MLNNNNKNKNQAGLRKPLPTDLTKAESEVHYITEVKDPFLPAVTESFGTDCSTDADRLDKGWGAMEMLLAQSNSCCCRPQLQLREPQREHKRT